MNRKGTREQNDISIIIGNLPKRLQDKIIIREGNNSNSGGGTGSGGNVIDTNKKGAGKSNQHETTRTNNDGLLLETQMADGGVVADRRPTPMDGGVTTIDYFLRLPTGTDVERTGNVVRSVLETSGPTTKHNGQMKVLQKHATENGDSQESVSIPGLIRLNAENVKKLNETSSSSHSNGVRNHERRNRHQTRQEVLATSKNIMPMSPVRHVQRINHPNWFDLLEDTWASRLPQLFENLQQILQQNQAIENWNKLRTLRNELQDIFQQLLLKNLKFCCEQKVDSFFWKVLFYNMREHLKEQQQQQQGETEIIKYIRAIIDDGIKFYDHLYVELEKQYLFKKKVLINGISSSSSASSSSQRSQQKLEFIAKVMAQKILICLGDLWRYKIKDAQGQDYSTAEKYYQSAQALVPSNGVPYNQLAIIAILNRKKFDAIYFHMRSLMSSNAIYSSKESLLVLFDEIRKKYEETELKSSPVHANFLHNNNSCQSKSMRKEVWIYPDGLRRLHRTDFNGNSNYKLAVSEEKRFKEMPVEELLRRIVSLYLYIIGKLFNGVGMETIVEHQRKLLMQFDVLLQHNKIGITRTRLLKILALNIFVMEHNLNKDTRRYHAFNFCNQFFGLLLRKTNSLLTDLNDNPEEFEDEKFMDLTTVLQYNRIYILWLQHHVNIWEPIKNEELLKEENLTIPSDNEIKYEEDIFLAGFTPTSAIIPKPKDDNLSDEGLQLKARLKIICDFENFYRKHNKRLENVETSSHFITEVLNSDIKQALDDLQSTQTLGGNVVAAEEDNNENCNNVNEARDNTNCDDSENNTENIVVNGDALPMKANNKSLKVNPINGKMENDQLSQLSKLKRELEAKSNVKKMYSNKLEEILKFVDTKLYIEVRPKYLLPDTNCFIDCLEDFERIVNEFKRYTLIVPLTVVKELDGLSKGVKVESSLENMQKHRIHHYDDVSTRAKKSLDFIKSAKSHVKCATTKGSIINASLFALVEEEHVSNDDKILATAVALSKTMSTETIKDGKCFIQTELILITTDRNLRVKALSRNLTVSELPEFIQWAKDCN
ncbi:telomerase-binding protein EST1A-like [Musca vetustissima]|uniref:telomerase-binding protein EST1A-like n=1 Tax=Musca vetustissima TaxID=27455 RepID=UPI002AB6F96F|nr:telomerase-binding protein EST1A-like [Musca vetustissima]